MWRMTDRPKRKQKGSCTVRTVNDVSCNDGSCNDLSYTVWTVNDVYVQCGLSMMYHVIIIVE